MGVTASQPSDADLSWEAGLYRYDVRSARAKTHAAGQDAYLISVSKVEHKRPEPPSSSTLSDTCESAEGDHIEVAREIEIARENHVGLVISYRDSKSSWSQWLLRRSDFTAWEALCENFECIVRYQRSRKVYHYVSDYDMESEDSDHDAESEDLDNTRPREYECVALYAPTNGTPKRYLETIDWHKAMSEVVKGDDPENPHSIVYFVRPALPDEPAIDDDPWTLSTMLEDISISCSTLSICTLSCGIVIGMALSKYYVEKAS